MDTDDETTDLINVTLSKPGPSRKSTTPKTTAPRHGVLTPVVEIATPRKQRRLPAIKGMEMDTSVPNTVRTPLSRATPSSNRATPAPHTKSKSKPSSKSTSKTASMLVTPIKPRTPTNRPCAKSTAKSTAKTLASSIKNPLPTPIPAPPNKRPRVDSLTKSTQSAKLTDLDLHVNMNMDGIEDAFSHHHSPSSISAVSRETFLANEASKRQREAREFQYKGEANAPKLTRSGRVIGAAEPEEQDEYGGNEEDNTLEVDETELEVEIPVPTSQKELLIAPAATLSPSNNLPTKSFIAPLPTTARSHVINILSTLTSKLVGQTPPAFADEETNGALNGLVNLLKGTVERGEGNSALIVGSRGVGKTRTVARALNLLQSGSLTSPIIVRLSGHAQVNDRLAIREMGRQIAEAEGKVINEEDEEEGDEADYAPTTLPSHLLALLTTPSPRAIIIIMEEFDLFTEHARQALLYCLLDVVQSVKTGPVESTGRGIAVIGVTCRVDTLLLLEKRVKSRFSHRMWRVISPLSSDGPGWKEIMGRVLVPWEHGMGRTKEDREVIKWKGDWQFAVDMLLGHENICRSLDRLAGLTTDVRNLYRPFIVPICEILSGHLDFLTIPNLVTSILAQIENAGWGLTNTKLKGLSQPAICILIIAKHLAYAGREEFTFAQVEEEYLKFSRTRLVGSGKTRWPVGVLRAAFENLCRIAILAPASSSGGHNSNQPRFAKVRSTLSPHEIVGWVKSDGQAVGLGSELIGWGKMMGGHV